MQFLELHEDDASLIRVGLYVTAAGIHEKHIAVREIGINRAVILADNRVPMENDEDVPINYLKRWFAVGPRSYKHNV